MQHLHICVNACIYIYKYIIISGIFQTIDELKLIYYAYTYKKPHYLCSWRTDTILYVISHIMKCCYWIYQTKFGYIYYCTPFIEIDLELYKKLHSREIYWKGGPQFGPQFITPLRRNPLRQPMYSQRNLIEILLNKSEIRLYFPFSDWFGSKRTSVWFQINRRMVNTIWFQFDLIRFRKYFSVCK